MANDTRTEKLVAHVPVASAQLIVLDPANLPDDGEAAYERVVKVTTKKGAGPVKLSADEAGKPSRSPAGEASSAAAADPHGGHGGPGPARAVVGGGRRPAPQPTDSPEQAPAGP
jgi:hypothetical protein